MYLTGLRRRPDHAPDLASFPWSLPLVREKLITFEVIPLKPYPGLARLFAGAS